MKKEHTRNELIAYAMDCASYLIANSTDIERIILHGSVVRGDFDEESDVDLFIDTKERGLSKRVPVLVERYTATETHRRWKLKGIELPFSVLVGSLESTEWQQLKRAMLATGIILYGKYIGAVKKAHQYTLFSFENIKPHATRVALFRKLFGFQREKKTYEGLVNKSGAVRIGKGSIIVPAEHVQKIIALFHEKKITVRLYDVWSDEPLS